jgi:hypothetical protein
MRKTVLVGFVQRPIARLIWASLFVIGCTPGEPPRSSQDRDSAQPAVYERPGATAVMPSDLAPLAPRPGASVQRVAVRRDTSTFSTGPAVALLSSGDSVVLADSVVRAWSFAQSPLVAVSGLDGAGGYENEGQSLTVINVVTGARRRVVSDYFQIVKVDLIRDGGHSALLVHMMDGGQGSLHVTVVDPARGPVFRQRNALGRALSDGVAVSSFGDGAVVEFSQRGVPLRVDTIPLAAVGTMGLLVVPRENPR